MQLSKAYEPGLYESDIYALWEKNRVFEPTEATETYSIVMPPPNANGNLHIGYELTAALEDIAARYQRMRGKATLLLPGADHAGFETQVVYEKHLAKEGLSRFDLSRDELYGRIWDFVAQNRGNFVQQMRRMGVGCDWSRFHFTLDETIVNSAYRTFKRLWDEGLIYRGERLVNFCTFHGTAFADIEVEYQTEQGHLWHLHYPLSDGKDEIIVATTRPETMLGDTAVAVHPEDKRYRRYIGKTVRLPLSGREIPIIADEFVDPAFGSGAVKITPAHDPNDFEAGRRHDLPMPSVIDFDGTMKDVPETYRGLPVMEARKAVLKDLAEQGLIAETEDYDHNVGHCYKCGTVIQPLLKDQWFIDMQPLAKPAIKALKDGAIDFHPAAKREQLIGYLEGLRDWNVSRQIAWGIPIPAFQNVEQADDWIYDESVNQERIERDGKTYQRDPDVFDTWFSSSSWPYATLDWPDGKDFERFYPLSLMETGGEILYPWVSRMIMLGLYNTGKVPFRSVYIHGYVMAEDGSKMSKSIGNVVDPMPVIDEYGSDALRVGIVQGRAPAVNRGYDSRKVVDGRNFCNKLWNIARYAEHAIGQQTSAPKPAPESIADHWILTKLQQSSLQIADYLEEYRFSEAYEALYHLVWDEVADWYVEASKTTGGGAMLAYVLDSVLRLAHPFVPFVSETIWQTLPWTEGSVLAAASWPEVKAGDKQATAGFERIQAIVGEVRYLTKALGVSQPRLHHDGSDSLLSDQAGLLCQLARLEEVGEAPGGEGVRLVRSGVEAWLDVDSGVIATYVEELRLKRQAAEQQMGQLRARLSNRRYVDGAPSTVVAQSRQQLSDTEVRLQDLDDEITRFTA